MIKGCIFDLDGTLLSTLPTIAYYGNITLEKFGFLALPVKNYKYYCGNGARVLVKRIMKDSGADDSLFDSMFDFYNKAYNSDTAYLTKPYDGIKDMLIFLKNSQIKTAVISNKPDFATKAAVNNFLPNMFDIVRGGTDDVPLKPNPSAIFEIMSDLGICSSECIYIGDTDVDMQTGKNAGIFTVGVLWGFRTSAELENNGADMIVKIPHEISDYVAKTV